MSGDVVRGEIDVFVARRRDVAAAVPMREAAMVVVLGLLGLGGGVPTYSYELSK
jgi:hypothetical protein